MYKLKTTVQIRNTEFQDGIGFGRGIVALLEGIERSGSIYSATKEMGMAYSKAWKIIRLTEEEFQVRLLTRNGVHGSALTEEAKRMVAQYQTIIDAAADAAQQVFRQYCQPDISASAEGEVSPEATPAAETKAIE